jgi:phage tail sheath protein FI
MSQINETAIKTPGVYTTEIPVFPPSVAQVATAVPAFIGYTEKASRGGKDVTNRAVRISSLVQFVQYFGDAFDQLGATVALNADNTVAGVDIQPKYQLFNAIRLFFSHGGSNCYIISVGTYKNDGTAAITDFIAASGVSMCFDALRKEDEPTLIVVPDAVMLPESDFYQVMSLALRQCSELQDRFTILDVYNGDRERSFSNDDVITNFRTGVGGSYLNYGAAYYPWLRTSLQYQVRFADTRVEKPKGTAVALNTVVVDNAFLSQLDKLVSDQSSIVTPFVNASHLDMGDLHNAVDLANRINDMRAMLTGFIGLGGFTDTTPAVKDGQTMTKLHEKYKKEGTAPAFSTIEKLARELVLINSSYPLPGNTPNNVTPLAPGDFPATFNFTNNNPDISIYGNNPPDDLTAVKNITGRLTALYSNVSNFIQNFLNDVRNLADGLEMGLASSSGVYANIKEAIKREGIIAPPAGAIAGVYAAVDGTRGVWKAPANVSLNTVIEPVVSIDNNIQDDLNVDVNSGKSINAIRTFTGKGTLVWGARTLAGNDNEWRYISVRRFFIMVEESAKKATDPFVFEPNDANTWAKVRGMLENFLLVLWRQGALAGAKPEHAFFVKCGLGQTMTAQDILEGKLIVEIGMAAVRPAEFIILRFSHKLQES